MNNRSSSISKCQPSCGYYFSSGLVVSETVYSSASHGPVYNVASRIIVDGGRRVLQTAAMAGMLAQNFTVPGYANTIITSTYTTPAGSKITSAEVSGLSAIHYVYGMAISNAVRDGGVQIVVDDFPVLEKNFAEIQHRDPLFSRND